MSRYKQPFSLFKRGKYWYYRTYTPDGIRTTAKTTGCTSKGAAVDYCNKLYLAGFLCNNSLTFKSFANGFYDIDGIYFSDRVQKPALNTVKNYQKQLKNVLLPYFDSTKLCDIDYLKLKTFRTWLINQGYSPQTIQQIMNILKHIIDTAYKSRKIMFNPFDLLESIALPQRERDAFTLEEVKILYDKIAPEFKNAVLVMALTGVRISECVGLQYNDIIKAPEGFIYIDLQKQYVNKQLTQLKNKNSRPIPIIPEIQELIGFEPLRLSAFYREFNAIKDSFHNAQERLLCFHSLRHFFITNSKANNVADVKVEFIAGHSLKNVRKVYTNFKAGDLLDILDWQKATLDKIKG